MPSLAALQLQSLRGAPETVLKTDVLESHQKPRRALIPSREPVSCHFWNPSYLRPNVISYRCSLPSCSVVSSVGLICVCGKVKAIHLLISSTYFSRDVRPVLFVNTEMASRSGISS